MNVRDEINQFSSKDDKPILLWLFSKYHKKEQWDFVAYCKKERYGCLSYETNRIWIPKDEGRILYDHYKDELKFLTGETQ